MAITIRVDEARLVSKAGQITDRIECIEKALQAMSEQIRSSANYWEGEASDTHRAKFNQMENNTKQSIAKLKRHPTHLLTMAGLYRSTEQENARSAQALSGNVIS